jgi:hypothetical protein
LRCWGHIAVTQRRLHCETLRYVCNPWQRFFPLEQDLRERQFNIVENENLAWKRRQGTYEGPPIMRRFAGLGR